METNFSLEGDIETVRCIQREKETDNGVNFKKEEFVFDRIFSIIIDDSSPKMELKLDSLQNFSRKKKKITN